MASSREKAHEEVAEMESSIEKTKDKENLDSPLVKVAETASNADRHPPFYRDSPLEEVATAITELVGDLDTHALNLEEVKKVISKEVRALDSPSIAFKLNDLQTLFHSVLIKVRSYTSTCKDVKEFVSNFEEEPQSLEEMLDFLSEMKSFSSPMKEELSVITKAIEAATTAVKEQKDAIVGNKAAAQGSGDAVPPPPSETSSMHQIHTTPNSVIAATQVPHVQQPSRQKKCDPMRLFSMIFPGHSPEQERKHAVKAMLDACAKQLKELAVEIERIEREVVEKYSTNINISREKCNGASDHKEISAGIRKIRQVCASRSV